MLAQRHEGAFARHILRGHILRDARARTLPHGAVFRDPLAARGARWQRVVAAQIIRHRVSRIDEAGIKRDEQRMKEIPHRVVQHLGDDVRRGRHLIVEHLGVGGIDVVGFRFALAQEGERRLAARGRRRRQIHHGAIRQGDPALRRALDGVGEMRGEQIHRQRLGAVELGEFGHGHPLEHKGEVGVGDFLQRADLLFDPGGHVVAPQQVVHHGKRGVGVAVGFGEGELFVGEDAGLVPIAHEIRKGVLHLAGRALEQFEPGAVRHALLGRGVERRHPLQHELHARLDRGDAIGISDHAAAGHGAFAVGVAFIEHPVVKQVEAEILARLPAGFERCDDGALQALQEQVVFVFGEGVRVEEELGVFMPGEFDAGRLHLFAPGDDGLVDIPPLLFGLIHDPAQRRAVELALARVVNEKLLRFYKAGFEPVIPRGDHGRRPLVQEMPGILQGALGLGLAVQVGHPRIEEHRRAVAQLARRVKEHRERIGVELYAGIAIVDVAGAHFIGLVGAPPFGDGNQFGADFLLLDEPAGFDFILHEKHIFFRHGFFPGGKGGFIIRRRPRADFLLSIAAQARPLLRLQGLMGIPRGIGQRSGEVIAQHGNAAEEVAPVHRLIIEVVDHMPELVRHRALSGDGIGKDPAVELDAKIRAACLEHAARLRKVAQADIVAGELAREVHELGHFDSADVFEGAHRMRADDDTLGIDRTQRLAGVKRVARHRRAGRREGGQRAAREPARAQQPEPEPASQRIRQLLLRRIAFEVARDATDHGARQGKEELRVDAAGLFVVGPGFVLGLFAPSRFEHVGQISGICVASVAAIARFGDAVAFEFVDLGLAAHRVNLGQDRRLGWRQFDL